MITTYKNKENELESTPIFIKIQNLYLNSGFIPPLTDEVKSDFSREKEFSAVFFKMVRSGVLVRYDEKHYMHRDIRKKALDMAVTLYKEKGVTKPENFVISWGYPENVQSRCWKALTGTELPG